MQLSWLFPFAVNRLLLHSKISLPKSPGDPGLGWGDNVTGVQPLDLCSNLFGKLTLIVAQAASSRIERSAIVKDLTCCCDQRICFLSSDRIGARLAQHHKQRLISWTERVFHAWVELTTMNWSHFALHQPTDRVCYVYCSNAWGFHHQTSFLAPSFANKISSNPRRQHCVFEQIQSKYSTSFRNFCFPEHCAASWGNKMVLGNFMTKEIQQMLSQSILCLLQSCSCLSAWPLTAKTPAK